MYKRIDLHIKLKNKEDFYIYNVKDIEYYQKIITIKDIYNTAYIYEIKDIIYIYTLK